MKMPMKVVVQKINRKLVRKYGEEVALDRLIAIGDILFEYVDDEEYVSKEFYDYIMKNI